MYAKERFTILVSSFYGARTFVYHTDRETAIEIARNVFAVCARGEKVTLYLAGKYDPILEFGGT